MVYRPYGVVYTDPLPGEVTGLIAPTEELSVLVTNDLATNVITYRYEYVTYAIDYELDGGSNGANPGTFNIDSTFVLEPASKIGYDFVGWFDGEDKVTTIAKGTVGNKSFVARYAPAEYSITFNGNGATGSMESASFTYDPAGYSVPENGFTVPAEKVFLGWTVNNAGSILAVGDKTVVTDDVTLLAVWGDADITIVFNANGAVGTMSDLVYSRGESNVIANAFTMEHYTFTGWNTEADGSGIQYPAGVDAKNIARSCTLYAQ